MLRPLALAAASAALLAAGATAAGAQPSGHAARTCKPPTYPGQGYFTSLSVAHVTCATGKKVMLAHYRCRIKHGRKGRCSSVLHYRCSEVRRSIATEFTSRTTCKRGSRRVVFTYQQQLD
jgi:hypothetical protein